MVVSLYFFLLFQFNPNDNGGESLLFSTIAFANGSGGFYLNQMITLNSYQNAAILKLCGAIITPEMLRKLATEL